ncbi:MAG: DNA primase [Chthoniobacterales bacterium]
MPQLASATPALRLSDDGRQAEMIAGERQWRVRGLETNTSFDHLKVNLRLSYRNRFHLDTLDLYAARARAAFLAQGQEVTGAEKAVLESDLARLIAQLEAQQEKKIMAAMKPVDVGPVMSPEAEAAALKLLKEPRLFERILADFASVGTVGEEANKLLGYLIAVSRKLEDPLSGLIVSRSAAGKSSLLGAILDFVPEEEKQVVTSMTTQALYYLPNEGLKHKVLAVVEDEGSETASYPLKILQSEKKLILAVTVKDPDGGMPKTELKTVEGPVAQFMTSTQAEFDEELANRYLVLSVDEERAQTRRIHAAQREAETLRGLLRTLERDEILRTHHNAQRLLRPLRVVNPFADQLTFPDDQLRLRRDHKKYLGLIRTIAFLRQYQKPIKSCEHREKTLQYIEVDEDDLRLAHELAAQVLGRSLDELAPPSRAFLLALHALIATHGQEQSLPKEKVRFTRREVRENLKWSEPQVRRHLDKLQELEYVLCHRVPGTAARFVYELIYDGEGKDGNRFILGLGSNGCSVTLQSSLQNGESSR